jgi:hypothetical protein
MGRVRESVLEAVVASIPRAGDSEMLEIEGHKAALTAAQTRFAYLVRKEWSKSETRTLVWRPDRIDLEIAHNNRFWFASTVVPNESGELRHWNSFGVYNSSGPLQIALEINIPVDRIDGRVSGFVAVDAESAHRFVLHDGGVGGGFKGVGRDAFLESSGLKPIPVALPDGRVRFGVVVAALDSHSGLSPLVGFLERAIEFKARVRSGTLLPQPGSAEPGESYRKYFKEFSGRKSGLRSSEIDYVSRHGDIVDALNSWCRKALSLEECNACKNALIDLALFKQEKMVALFEVKTGTDRQQLYTAIGQLEVHGRNAIGLKKFVVVPNSGPVAADISEYLALRGITLIRFELGKNAIRLFGPT